MTPQNILHAHLYGGPHDGLDLVVCPADKFVPPVLTIARKFNYAHRKQDQTTGVHIYCWPGCEALAARCSISTAR